MAPLIRELKIEAERKFLGRGPVIGIGIGGPSEDQLVFMLEAESLEMQQKIRDWAKVRAVLIQFQVTGPIASLSCEF